jgi:hypothetical protein
MPEPRDIWEEIKATGAKDHYEALILNKDSLTAITILAAYCREKDQIIKHQQHQLAQAALTLCKSVGNGWWTGYADMGDLGREILKEFAEEEQEDIPL